MSKTMKLEPKGFVFRPTPLLVIRALRRFVRRRYLKRFWEANRQKKSSDKFTRPAIEARQAKLSRDWIAANHKLRLLELKALDRARKLRLSGKI